MRRIMLVLAVICGTGAADAAQDADSTGGDVRDSVVKIFTTSRAPDLERPWTKQQPQESTGSGFVLDGNRILTNSHVVEHASQVFVQPPKSSDRLRAEVVAIAGGIDLAVLEIRRESEAEEFFAAHPPLTLADELPAIGSTVQAIGFPMGGEQQSLTEGVVSRIEFTGYYYNTPGLRIQVDAALNPGNSGGPVVMDNEVIGVVFSGIDQADNIGYIIPIEEVRAFLDDVADGEYDGRPRVRLSSQTLENDAIRAKLGLSRDQTGLMISRKPKGESPLQVWDVLDRIGEHDIDNAGLVTLDGDLRLAWQYLIPKLSGDGSVPMTIIRDGESMEITLPVSPKSNQLLEFLAGDYPEYFIFGPIVFTPAYSEHFFQGYPAFLATIRSPLALRSNDEREFDGEQLVVVPSSLLPHPIGKGYEVSFMPTLKSVNGVEIKNLEHLVETIVESDDEYLIFEFHDINQETFVFDREAMIFATEEILEDNGIRRQMSRELEDIWGEGP